MYKTTNLFLIALLIFVPIYSTIGQTITLEQLTQDSQPEICLYINNNLRLGDKDESTGGAVTVLQNYLYSTGDYPRIGEGFFGWGTFYAVAKFQRSNNLPATGYFGPLTRAKITESVCLKSIPEKSEPIPIEVYLPVETINEIESISSSTISVASTSPILVNEKTLPYEKSSYFYDWEATWGEATTTDEGIFIIGSTGSTTGASVVLNGSENWVDYDYTVNIVANGNGSFSLLGRYIDGNNFVACSFSGNSVWIQEKIDGNSKNVASTHVDLPLVNSVFRSTEVNMKISGNRVICSATGADDVVGEINSSRFVRGGVGISIWHSVLGVTSLQLRSVKIGQL